MSCSELGFTDCDTLRLSRSVDYEGAGTFPASFDWTGFTGELVFRDSTGDIVLTITQVENDNGSFLTFAGREVAVRIKAGDIAALPEEASPTDPWVGTYQWNFADPEGLSDRLKAGVVVVEL